MKSLRQEAKASQNAKMGRMTHGYAKGGFVPPKVGSDDRLPVANVAETKAAGKIGGAKAKTRLDRPGFAAGGRAKKGGKTNVTVIVAPGGGPQAGANPATPPMPPPMAGPSPLPPPMPPPPGAGPAGGPPPPGMPVHAAGGRVIGRNQGGRIPHKAWGGGLGMQGGRPPVGMMRPGMPGGPGGGMMGHPGMGMRGPMGGTGPAGPQNFMPPGGGVAGPTGPQNFASLGGASMGPAGPQNFAGLNGGQLGGASVGSVGAPGGGVSLPLGPQNYANLGGDANLGGGGLGGSMGSAGSVGAGPVGPQNYAALSGAPGGVSSAGVGGPSGPQNYASLGGAGGVSSASASPSPMPMPSGAGPSPMPTPGGPAPMPMGSRKTGGRVKRDSGGAVVSTSSASLPKETPKLLQIDEGPIEKLGVKTYRREVGRDMKSGSFGKYPYSKGGRAHKADGGAVGTKVSHDPQPNDRDNIFPERPVGLKRADGGRTFGKAYPRKGYPIDDSAAGGEGRLEKIGKHS